MQRIMYEMEQIMQPQFMTLLRRCDMQRIDSRMGYACNS